MQHPPIFQTKCSDGYLFVDQLNIYVMAPFNRLVWTTPRNTVTNLVPRHGFFTADMEVHSAHGIYTIKKLSRRKANEFFTLLARPAIQTMRAQTTGIPIDAEIQRVKLEVEQRRLQLRQVNSTMANVRSKYQQNHVHGGGKLGRFAREMQRSSKDSRLRKQQPLKEKLQREKLALEQQLNHLRKLKAQGVTHITSSRKAR